MAKAYVDAGMAEKSATFEFFFRRCPFNGEYAVLAGHDRIRDALENFKFTDDEIDYLRKLPFFSPHDDPTGYDNFFSILKNLSLKNIEILAMPEGSLVFPRTPVLQVRGPILEAQLLESIILNSLNFATLIATNARRIRMAAKNRKLVEFGLRRAQGPDGAMTATRSSYLGGFDGTSNVLAAKQWNIPPVGTIAHSFIQSFLSPSDKEEKYFGPNRGELAAFMAYAKSFPNNCLLLIDTYDTLHSGLPNAIETFRFLKSRGHSPLGVRIDSGDLVYLSTEVKKCLDAAGFPDCEIYATNELDEAVIDSIEDQDSAITGYGVGTRLVTATADPALGGVYKLVEFDGHPRLKISEQTEKIVIPGEKKSYRFFDHNGEMILDYLTLASEPEPKPGAEYLGLHPLDPYKRLLVKPHRIEKLLHALFQQGSWTDSLPVDEIRRSSLEQMQWLRTDIQRRANPTPYKVSLSPALKKLTDELYISERPDRSFLSVF